MITVISGIRELAEASNATVEDVILDVLAEHPTEMRLGGALGVDSIALEACAWRPSARTKVRVFAPGTARSLPRASQQLVAEYADQLVELKGDPRDKSSYLRRNDTMLDGSQQLIAFTDGRTTGGTAYTIRTAQARRIPVRIVEVLATKSATTKINPSLVYRLDDVITTGQSMIGAQTAFARDTGSVPIGLGVSYTRT